MVEFETAKVIEITSMGEGTRVCLDLIDELDPLEGVLIGNTGSGYLMAVSENRSTDTYPPRPFRINAGAYHHYVLLDEEKTDYLAEMRPGMKIPVWKDNNMRLVPIGRVKMEKRSFIRIVCQELKTNQEISVTVQEADSVHLLGADQTAKSAISLTIGDELICYPDEPGRHLGEKIIEEITEK
ncbi:3-dehydroquinate synthase II [Amphibacillus sp. Q70]|uniref:3-dehydroquinate synthase II n=1 Tax=Amphibacillus sp. Q70 TaxID=3453416 RepID=UPI003F85775F